MKEKIRYFFVGGKYFKKEFIEQMRLLIVFSLGFTIAFSWRQTIYDSFETIVEYFTHAQNSVTLSVLTSLLTTIVALVVIFFTSKLLKQGE
jgi:ABC-type Fe3+ transport system permease subunit